MHAVNYLEQVPSLDALVDRCVALIREVPCEQLLRTFVHKAPHDDDAAVEQAVKKWF
jgi:hypothetical protein